MDMQDKDFDKLFNSKFEDFEAEPSPRVWENIADELEDKKAVLPWMTYLSVAAGIVFVFTAGWLFLQKDLQTGERHHNYANLVHHDIVKPATSETTASVVKQPEPAVVGSASKNGASAARIASSSNHSHTSVSSANRVAAPVSNKVDDVVKESQPVVNNLGGLINVLVSKVDKRANKFIEFSDGEDDEAETTVTGVNMGPIKFKKQ
jgi:hypothetical protein